MGATKTIDLEIKIVRKDEVLASNLDDEVVMMNLESDSYYGMNPVGSRIWELLERPLPVAELCAKLQEEFDVDDETCQGDVLPFIQKTIDEKLVRIVE